MSVGSREHAPLIDLRESIDSNYQPLRLWYLPTPRSEDDKPKVSKSQCNAWTVTVIVHEIVRLLTGAAQKKVCLGERSVEGKDIVILVARILRRKALEKL